VLDSQPAPHDPPLVADIDREAFPVQHELVQVNDVVRSVLPLVVREAGEDRVGFAGFVLVIEDGSVEGLF
jgi:hypothetical protein